MQYPVGSTSTSDHGAGRVSESRHVRIRPSGRQISVRPGETVLGAALRQGVVLPYSCRNGTCASCRAQLIDGAVSYPGAEPAALEADDLADGAALLCQAVPDGEVEAVRGIRTHVLPARVQSRERLSHEVMRVMLQLPRTPPLNYLAGQYMDVLLSGGRRRAFSIASPPSETGFLELHVKHVAGGGFTGHVFETMNEREILRLEGPLGTFFIRQGSDRPMIMVAGGTGFAPVKAMIEELLIAGDTRPVHLYWGARSPDELYQTDLVAEWSERHPDLRFEPVLSEGGGIPGYRSGWVHEAVIADHPDLSGFDVYMSGPPAMIDAARHAFAEADVDPDRLFYDSFDFSPDSVAAVRKGASETS